jgi:hypothetical protein
MSSMLEQAIVDATALREAALKNAEASIIEKYASEIKNAVETLLEEEPSGSPEAIVEDSDIPPAFAEGDAVCPSDGDKVEVYTLTMDDIKDLGSQMDAEASDEVGEDFSDEMLKEIAEAVLEEDDEEALEEEAKPDFLDLDKDGDKEESMKDAAEDKEEAESVDETIEEDFVLDEEAIAALVEELVVDISPQKGGWAGTPESVMQHNEELALAQAAATEAREENEALRKAAEELSESNTNLKKSNKTLKETVLKLKSAFDEMSTSNAKLLYTNRILSSPSLNERQKEKIVEAISKAGSVDEAKVIYETLQSTGGTSRRRQVPQSLSETIQRSSTTVLPRRQSEKRTTDTAIDRLQILAGIKNNK